MFSMNKSDKKNLKRVWKRYHCHRNRKHTDFYVDTKRGLIRCVLCNDIVDTVENCINKNNEIKVEEVVYEETRAIPSRVKPHKKLGGLYK